MLKQILSRGLLLIYQMPKTGSQTVEATVHTCDLPHLILRFHFLSPEISGTMLKALRSGQGTPEWQAEARKQLQAISSITRTIRIRKYLSLFHLRLPKIHVITGVREPIGLGLSSVFENHSYLFPNLESATVEGCRTELLRPKALTYIQDWFDLEIKRSVGIDVFDSPFPHTKGYAICENAFARLLVFRSDFLPKLPAMLKEFLGCNPRAVINRNLGTAKDYAEAYATAKARLRLPTDFVVSQYNRRLARHFYSVAERRRLLLRWAESSSESTAMALAA